MTGRRFLIAVAYGVAALTLVLGLLIGFAGKGWLGETIGAGVPLDRARPPEIGARDGRQQQARAAGLGRATASEILFGDLHVHTGFSQDAFTLSMPLTGGSGRHTVADACDFARYCSGLDFWSINDHAESSTPRRWRETIEAIRACDAVAAAEDGAPDLVSFLGWEWSHMGTTPENHYGHRNVVLRDLEADRIPTRPIAADSPAAYFQSPSTFTLGLLPLIARDTNYLRYATYTQETSSVEDCPSGTPVRDLPVDCREKAATPGALFEKLDDWGFASLVIPHGTTWGMYTPPGSDWSKQLSLRDHDPARQRLVEVYSGHGNTEPFRDWRATDFDAAGGRHCPAPREDYMPACWQAGEIIRARCLEEDAGATGASADCEARAAEARRHFVEAPAGLGHLAVPAGSAAEWLDAGQCRDCFLPAFNYRPGGAVQSMLAQSSPGSGEGPLRFRFGFIGSSDIHTSRPGTGYKEVQRTRMSDVRLARVDLPVPAPAPVRAALARPADPTGVPANDWIERERAGSFFYTGGLVAVHAAERSRDGIWDAMDRRATYATSGPRILLWFDLLNPTPDARAPVVMGGSAKMSKTPIFEVRAVGSREQEAGCPASTRDRVGEDRLERLCGGECFFPSDRRRPISRIEVIRIRPQRTPDEPIAALIEDPWRSFPCAPDPEGCRVAFSDPDFATAARDAVYYARAIEVPSPAVNGDGLRCEGEGCARTRPCLPWAPDDDACLGDVEERAWSSPIFVDWAGAATPTSVPAEATKAAHSSSPAAVAAVPSPPTEFEGADPGGG